MQEFFVDIDMVATRFKMKMECQEVEPASGIQYMLLKMLDYGASRNLRISDVMSIFSIADDLMPFIIGELRNLADKGMIVFKNSAETKDPMIKNITFTDKGKQNLEKRQVTGATKIIERDMLYYPYKTYLFTRDSGVNGAPAASVRVPRDKLKAYILDNMAGFGVNERSELSKDPEVTVDGEHYRTIKCTEKQRVTFHNETGTFRVDYSNSQISEEYIRKKYTGDKILGQIPKEWFELRDIFPFEVKKWNESTPEKVEMYFLPQEFNWYEGLFFYGNNLKNVNRPNSIKLPSEIDCDYAILRENEGYKYWFLSRDSPLEGFDSKKNVKMVAYAPMSKSERDKCVSLAVSGLRVDKDENLETIGRISHTMRNPSVFADRIAEYLKESNVKTLEKLVDSFNRLSTSNWRNSVEDVITDTVCRWIDEGADLKTVLNAVTVCNEGRYYPDKAAIVNRLMDKQDPLAVADWAFVNDFAVKTVTENTRFLETADSALTAKTRIPHQSEFMTEFEKLQKSYIWLCENTGVYDPTGYTFEYSVLKKKASAEIPAQTEVLRTSSDTVHAKCPALFLQKTTKALPTMVRLFGIIAEATGSEGQVSRRRDIKAAQNAIVFCTSLSRSLENTLVQILGTKKNLKTQMEKVMSKGIVSETTLETITEFVNFADGCRSRIDSVLVDNLKEAWVDAVFELAEAEY